MQNSEWLPKGYEVPKPQGDYMKFADGANKVRIMSAPVMGWEYFTKENKPVRSQDRKSVV